MPFKQIQPPVSVPHPDLVEALSAELSAPQDVGTDDAPYIIEELLPRSGYYNIRVIWDRWSEVGPRERIDVIMDAYRRVRGHEGMVKISSALGLTHREAEKLGVAA